MALTEGTSFDTTYPKIRLSSENDSITDSLTWKVYTGINQNQANVPSKGLTGIVHQSVPKNACSYLQPLPQGIGDTFAMVEGYPSCIFDMVANVRNAGYKLIIASSPNDTDCDVAQYIANSGFPIVIVTQKYANYLREHVAVKNIADIDYRNVIVATVYMYVSYASIIIPLAAGVCCVCCIFCSFYCIKYGLCDCSCMDGSRRRRQNSYRYRHIQPQPQRDELTASIQRHLAELRIDSRTHLALGEWTTKRLPTRKYQTGQEKNESCAICVNDFTDGDNLRVLPCEHVFHSECVDEWLINHSSLCPLCKQKVPRHKDRQNPRTNEFSRLGGLRQSSEYGAV